jgi:hypothetical protein
MTAATKSRDYSHARIYSSWVELPTWRALSPNARCLLVEMLARYHPDDNGRAVWSIRRGANVLRVSKSTAGRALIELERNGWIAVEMVARFGGSPKPATYTLSMFPDLVAAIPASRAFEHLPGERWQSPRKRASRPNGNQSISNGIAQSYERDKTVPVTGRDGSIRGTKQSRQSDTSTL